MGSKWAADHIHYWNWKLSEVSEAVWRSECKSFLCRKYQGAKWNCGCRQSQRLRKTRRHCLKTVVHQKLLAADFHKSRRNRQLHGSDWL